MQSFLSEFKVVAVTATKIPQLRIRHRKSAHSSKIIVDFCTLSHSEICLPMRIIKLPTRCYANCVKWRLLTCPCSDGLSTFSRQSCFANLHNNFNFGKSAWMFCMFSLFKDANGGLKSSTNCGEHNDGHQVSLDNLRKSNWLRCLQKRSDRQTVWGVINLGQNAYKHGSICNSWALSHAIHAFEGSVRLRLYNFCRTQEVGRGE